MKTRLLTFLSLLLLYSHATRAQDQGHISLALDQASAAHVHDQGSALHAQDADRLVETGDARYAAFDTRGAIEIFEAALAVGPATPDLLVRLARTWNDLAGDLHAEGDEQGARTASRQAISYSERLVAEHPVDARSWFYLAASTGTLALFSEGRDRLELGQRIEEYCLRSLDLDSTYALPHVALGMYYREVAGLGRLRRFLAKRLLGGLPDEPRRRALEHMATAERLSPDLPVVVFQRARTFEQFGGRSEAIEMYHRFVRMKPMNSRDFRNRHETIERFGTIASGRTTQAETLPK